MADTVPRWLPPLFAVAGRLAPEAAGRAAAGLLTRPGGRNPPQPWELEPTIPAPRSLVFPNGLRALAWGESGPVVLAQHGWRGRPTQFGRLATALLVHGHRLVAIDGPGHGGSPGRAATPRLFAEAMRAAAAELGGAEALVGHSLGGAATAIAIELGVDVKRLAVLSGPARASRMIGSFADRVALPARARAAFDRWFDAHAGRPVAELDLASLELDAQVEALVVHDVEDDVIPVIETRLLEAAWPSARFLYTRGLGHRDLLADASTMEKVAAFLAGVPAAVPRPQTAEEAKAAGVW